MEEKELATLTVGEKKLIKEEVSKCVRNGVILWREFNELILEFTFDQEVLIKDNSTDKIRVDPKKNKVPEAKYAWEVLFQEQEKQINERGKDKRGNYVKLFRDPNIEMNGNLTISQHTKLMRLIPLIKYDGKLIWKGEEMGKEELAAFFGYTTPKGSFTSKFLRPVVEAGALIKYKKTGIRREFYRFSEKVAYKGKGGNTDTPDHLKVFEKSLKSVLSSIEKEEKRKRSIAERKGKPIRRSSALGVLKAIMTHAHYQTSMLCKNPTTNICKEGESIKEARYREARKSRNIIHKPLKEVELRRLCAKNSRDGMDQSTFKEHINTLVKIGLLMKNDSGNTQSYYLFPLFATSDYAKGVEEYTQELITEFLTTWGSGYNKKKKVENLGVAQYIKDFKGANK